MVNHKGRVWVPLIALILHIGCFGETSYQDTIAKAVALYRSGKAKEAESTLRTASAAAPDSGALHGALGELLFNEKRFEDCIPELNRAVGIDPSSQKYTILLAEALIGTQRFGVAVDFLNGAAERFGNYYQLHYDLGLAYYFMNKVGEAQKEFEEAYRLAPKFDRAELLIAACLLAQGESAKAVDVLRRLVKERPTNAVYWGTLARTLGKMGDEHRGEALSAARHALALQPSDPRIQFDAATTLVEVGEFAEARPILEHLEKQNPRILAVHVQLAQVYARLGLRELARKENETVAKLPKQSAPENQLGLPDSQGGDRGAR